MKKIVGILAAVAMAGSLFAVDMSAALKFNGTLFNSTDKSALTLKAPEGRKPWGQTGIDLNVSADKAGATMNIDNAGTVVGYKMYVQPIDAVKINLGDLDYCLNKESIDWSGCINGAGGKGFGIDITPVAGLTLNVVLNPEYGNAWFKDSKVGNTNVYAKFASDAGTFGAALLSSENFKKNTISAGYSNNIAGVNMFADVAFVLADELTNIKADLFANGSVDAFGYACYVDFDQDMSAEKTAIGAKAKFTYNVGSCTPYLYVKCANVMADSFAMTVKPGVNFNIGAAGVEIAADISIADKTTVTVPFGVSVNF